MSFHEAEQLVTTSKEELRERYRERERGREGERQRQRQREISV